MSDNMLDILRNLDAAGKGEKATVTGENKGDMRTILESYHAVSEAPVPAIPSQMPPAAMPPQEPQGQPVSMNISLNASGKEHVEDLMGLMKLAGVEGNAPGDTKLDLDIDGDNQPDLALMPKEEDDMEEEYANEPEEEYGALDDVIPSGDDLHKKKKGFSATAGGDNPMAVESIKERLYRALSEKKKSKKGDGNLANNYPPYDKVTRGDIIAGATGKDQKGGKKKK